MRDCLGEGGDGVGGGPLVAARAAAEVHGGGGDGGGGVGGGGVGGGGVGGGGRGGGVA